MYIFLDGVDSHFLYVQPQHSEQLTGRILLKRLGQTGDLIILLLQNKQQMNQQCEFSSMFKSLNTAAFTNQPYTLHS